MRFNSTILALIPLSSIFFSSCGKKTKAMYPTADVNLKILSVTDIHFDPYSICKQEEISKIEASRGNCASMMNDLINSDASEWEKIFEKYTSQEKIAIKPDHTNYPLFKQFLFKIEQLSKNQQIDLAFILGDYLVYNFESNFKKFSLSNDPQKLEKFTKNTFAFISESINKKIGKNINVFPVLGNTDSYISNYNFDNPQNSNLYKDLKNIWGKNAPQISNSKSFNSGGYYSAELSDKNLTIFALNTTMFARNVKSEQKIDITHEADEQLDWLDFNLDKFNEKNENKKNKIIIISHIPVGVSAESSLNNTSTQFWKEDRHTDRYLNRLNKNKENIAGIFVGHTHEDIFQIIDKKTELASSTTPSLTSSRDNARFKIFKFDKNNVLFESTLYTLNQKDLIWKEENLSSSHPKAKNLFQIYLEKLDYSYQKIKSNKSSTNEEKIRYCASASGMTIKDFDTCLNDIKSLKQN